MKPRFGWLGAAGFFFTGCVATFVLLHFWQASRTSAPVARQNSGKLWRFETSFKVPQSFVVNNPTKEQILSFYVQKPTDFFEPYPVTIKNLTEHPYVVTYEILAYDAYNRRLDDATDSVTIGNKEIVLRKVMFNHPLTADAQQFVSFRLVADIEH